MQPTVRPGLLRGAVNAMSMSTSKSQSNSDSTKKRNRLATALLALTLASAASAGCGQVSFFEVAVVADNSTAMLRTEKLFEVDRCEVLVSGAVTDGFTLSDCRNPSTEDWFLGTFQYGTESESGDVTFTIKLYNGVVKLLGQGAATAPIKKGGRQNIEVKVLLDATNFSPG